MTPDILEYLLRLTVIWVVLVAYYFLALRRAGFAAQRFYLLGTLAFGLVVPLLPALGGGLPLVIGLPSVTYVAEPFVYTGTGVAERTISTWSWSAVLLWLYFAGAAFFAARTLVQWNGLRNWASSGKKDRYDGYRVIRHQAVTGPFVAFGMIFLPAEMSDASLERTALIHEASHLRARHHYDTLLLTLGSLLLWFHPLFWMLRRLLATVHEYEADAAVIRTVSARRYGLQLLQSSLCTSGFPGLFSSPIKHRIAMLTTKNRARKLRLLPLFALCFLLAGLVVACSDLGDSVATPTEETIEGPAENSLTDTDRSGGFYADTENLDASMNAYLKDVYRTIRYPTIARSTGTTGKFRAKIVMGTDGKIETIKVGEFTDELAGGPPAAQEIVIVGFSPDEITGTKTPEPLAEEIDRTLNATDKFKSMLKGGVPTRQSMNLDFTFKLEGEADERVQPLKKKKGVTEDLSSSESYQKGYDDVMAAAEKATQRMVDELAKTVYQKITYPAAARKAGETGKFDFLIDVDETGRIVNASYLKGGSEKDPSGEITVVGLGKADEAKAGNSDVLVKEVLQTLNGLQLSRPLKIMGTVMPAKLPVRFNFILEE